jgi:hypothetical protein
MTSPWGARLFRAGGILLILLGLLHSLSLIHPPEAKNDIERQLFDLMFNYRFDLAGSQRTMWNLFRGFSIAFMLGCFGMGGLDLALWNESNATMKRAALVTILWLATMLAVSLRYFFIFPTTCLAVSLLVFIVAWSLLVSAPSP